MFTDKEIVLQYKEDDSVQIQNQEEDDDEEEVMPELIQVLEKSEEENDKK